MIDIHAHVLPFVDDGAEDFDTSLKMLKIAVSEGITHMIATPHFINDALFNYRQETVQRLDDLSKRAVSEGIDIKLLPGNEIYMDPELPDIVEDKQVSTLNGSRYVLIELPLTDMPLYVDEVLFRLKLKGYIPVLAHPERNAQLAKHPEILAGYVEKGILCQINATSLTGLYGTKVQKTAMQFLKGRIAHFVATDAHTCRGRAPRLMKAFEIAKTEIGANAAKDLFIKNGMAVINNEVIDIPEPIKGSKRKAFFMSS